ncbi:SDR family NAD(P)-dependent oxidoreductase [Rhizobium gallicum]|uniref:SDR family NAD(P)-dependent oxidoreductase n=1 Tax=Rhizobium gallicum TaxID=56730 RepID=UPI003B8A99FD
MTGGARGFGLAIARRLSEEGCRVVIWDVNYANSTAASLEPCLCRTSTSRTPLRELESAAATQP